MKDFWKLVVEGVLRKGDIYSKLKANVVPNVPHCLNLGDVGDSTYYSTQTDHFVNKNWAPTYEYDFTSHCHYVLYQTMQASPSTALSVVRIWYMQYISLYLVSVSLIEQELIFLNHLLLQLINLPTNAGSSIMISALKMLLSSVAAVRLTANRFRKTGYATCHGLNNHA